MASTDLIATVPLAVASHLSDRPDIQLLALPFAPPRFAVQQHWHRAVHKDARHQWLRASVFSLFAGHAENESAFERGLLTRRGHVARP